jgi:hypothetical protein
VRQLEPDVPRCPEFYECVRYNLGFAAPKPPSSPPHSALSAGSLIQTQVSPRDERSCGGVIEGRVETSSIYEIKRPGSWTVALKPATRPEMVARKLFREKRLRVEVAILVGAITIRKGRWVIARGVSDGFVTPMPLPKYSVNRW